MSRVMLRSRDPSENSPCLHEGQRETHVGSVCPKKGKAWKSCRHFSALVWISRTEWSLWDGVGKRGSPLKAFWWQLKPLGTWQKKFGGISTSVWRIINRMQRSWVPTAALGSWKLERGLDGSGSQIQGGKASPLSLHARGQALCPETQPRAATGATKQQRTCEVLLVSTNSCTPEASRDCIHCFVPSKAAPAQMRQWHNRLKHSCPFPALVMGTDFPP